MNKRIRKKKADKQKRINEAFAEWWKSGRPIYIADMLRLLERPSYARMLKCSRE